MGGSLGKKKTFTQGKLYNPGDCSTIIFIFTSQIHKGGEWSTAAVSELLPLLTDNGIVPIFTDNPSKS